MRLRLLIGQGVAIGALILSAFEASGQLGPAASIPPAKKLVRVTAAPASIEAGGQAEAALSLEIAPGWHINANPPSPDYMIPTAIELSGGAGVALGRVTYPAPHSLKVAFEEQKLAVYNGRVTFRLPLWAAASASPGFHLLEGKLRFQACNDQVCLAPATIAIAVGVTVKDRSVTGVTNTTRRGGANSTPGIGTSGGRAPAISGTKGTLVPLKSLGAETGTAKRAAAFDNPIARQLEGGSWAAFVTLFLIGLALNLTPCVYPMLGITVSIFGARRAAPPLQVFGLALLYVLGMATMYSALGLVAAFTGGLFGGLLQNPIVLVVIGVLLIALSLPMFGLYEFQVPPALTARLGGTTAASAAGVFISGLLVGVFAAPCIGPPVVALLALVGAKGDPWFGFSSFFVLSMGLGAPYLVLATFSNLLQALPRSGEWMIWVKKLFGVVLVALGVFYALLGIAPDAALWVPPAALIIGGLYLGLFEKSAEKRPGFRWFKRVSGVAAAIAGVAIIITAPSQSVAFESFSPESLETALQTKSPVMLDFTADWCAPCHELERFTFTDARVRKAARSFRTFRVDLTNDSPESEKRRRDYGINGVPTVVFLNPRGDEVRDARVEGFLSPERFLERMRLAAQSGQQAATE